jgi:hypothetical protein
MATHILKGSGPLPYESTIESPNSFKNGCITYIKSASGNTKYKYIYYMFFQPHDSTTIEPYILPSDLQTYLNSKYHDEPALSPPIKDLMFIFDDLNGKVSWTTDAFGGSKSNYKPASREEYNKVETYGIF